MPDWLYRPDAPVRRIRSMDGVEIRLQPNGVPLYLQVVEGFEREIAGGRLASGERLPAERDLARALGISRTTAVNAYRELEARGLVRRHVGRGTYVCAVPESTGAPFAWRGKVSLGALRTDDPALRSLARSAGDPDVISFAAAVAARECFPVDAFREITDRVLTRHGARALGLGPTEGHPVLRRAIAAREKLHPEQVLVLNGAQQGLDLIARCLLDPGDAIILDRPGYLGAIQTFRAAGAVMVGWDVETADFAALEDLLIRYRPKLIYTTPTYQNPTGQTMPAPARRELLEIASRYRVPVVEDDPYRELGFSGRVMPSLLQLDHQGLVIHVGTFSKTLAGGLRIGWLTASEAIVDQLALIKQHSDVASATLEQLVVAEFLTGGRFDRHLAALRREHERRYQAMTAAVAHQCEPGEIDFRPVDGGMYLWCGYRAPIDARDLLGLARAEGVVFVNGESFYPDIAGRRQFRLAFSSVPVERIDEGIAKLAELLREVSRAQPARLEASGRVR
jgi:2-aminoadipate transaminase